MAKRMPSGVLVRALGGDLKTMSFEDYSGRFRLLLEHLDAAIVALENAPEPDAAFGGEEDLFAQLDTSLRRAERKARLLYGLSLVRAAGRDE